MSKDIVKIDNATGLEVHQSNDVAMSVNEARAFKEVEGAILLAKRFPRDEFEALQKVKKSCQRPTFAGKARYSFKRGGKPIKGASIYLAKEFSRLWGNIQHGFSITQDTDESRTVEGWAWDMETNVRTTSTSTFKKLHQRKNYDTDKTEWVVPNERDLRELTNKHGAICQRNAILAIVPADFIADLESQCELTLKGDVEKNRDDIIKKLVEAFDGMSVTTKMIESRYGYKLAELTPDDIVELRQIYESMKDGNTTRKDHFGVKQKKAAKASLDLGKLDETDKSKATPVQQMQKLAKKAAVSKADFDEACKISGLPVDILESGAIAAYADSNEYRNAINAIVETVVTYASKEG